MKYRPLGNSGLRVSELCFGAMSFGSDWGYGSDESESRKCFDAFVDAGGNFFDTADCYTEGHSEEYLGKFMKGKRDRLVIASKCSLAGPIPDRIAFPGDPNGAGNGRKHLLEALDASLKRLDTDYLDVFYIHVWDFVTPVEEVMSTLNDIVRSGKARYIGISNTPAYKVAQANAIADKYGWPKFVAYEGHYNLINRTIEREVLPMVRDLGLALTVWQPLCGAYLCGSEEELQIRIKCGYPAPSDAQMKIIRAVNDMAKEIGVSTPQVALNWLRMQPGTVIPIMGVRLAEHVVDNVNIVNWQLSAEQMKTLEDATKFDLGYPQNDLNTVLAFYIYNWMLKDIKAPERFPHYMKGIIG